MGRIIERRSFETVLISAFMITVFFFTILPSVGKAVTVTVENDAFIRCLIGDCRDTDTGYSEIQDPFESAIFGTDLGTFAAGEFYTYMFLGERIGNFIATLPHLPKYELPFTPRQAPLAGAIGPPG